MSSSNFSRERRSEAQDIMQLMMRVCLTQPFRGQFHTATKMPAFIIGADEDANNAYYGQAVGAACEAWGACAIQQDATEVGDNEAPFEMMLIGASMRIAKDPHQQSHMVEACAETTRVLLAGAIISAIEDKGLGDEVYAAFGSMPDVVTERDLTAGTITVLFRTMVKVIRSNNPKQSYVLGNRHGEKPRQLQYSLAAVELFYGPTRLRWLDARSPGHVETEQVAKSRVVG